MTIDDYKEATNCFGRLLDLMSEEELRDYSARAAALAFDPAGYGGIEHNNYMRVLHEVIEDEIAERKIDV